jgi:murein L,D-transpeptidase YcbB/YkuD
MITKVWNISRIVAVAMVFALAMPSGTLMAQSALNQNIAATVSGLSANDKAIKSFYQARNFAPMWVGSKNRKRRKALLDALNDASDHGLPETSYRVAELKSAVNKSRSNEAMAVAEVIATKAFLAYAQDISTGVVQSNRLHANIAIRPRKLATLSLLEAMSKSSGKAFLESLAPSHPDYDRLVAERKALSKQLGKGDYGPKLPNAKLSPGMSNGNVQVLRQRLTAMGYGKLGNDAKYDDKLFKVVKQFQLDHGLNADGVVGKTTIKFVNITPKERMVKVLVNLERQRWLNFERGKRHVLVNIPDFRVFLFDNGKADFSSRVVVGVTRKDQTPEFYDEMTHMVVNPTWHVPASIAGKEYLPILRTDPGFLGRQKMKMFNDAGTQVNPSSLDLSSYSEDNFPYFIKQTPNPANALGLVKFMFPNRFNIYLHDTPAKSLFNKDIRTFSHGCIRVQKPFEFAYRLLEKQSSNPEGTFKRFLNTGVEQYVNLKQSVPVYITYSTAFFDTKGRVNYRSDIYGRDALVYKALVKAGVVMEAVRG